MWGQYPFNYLEMIDMLFGKEDNTIEVCSGNVKEDYFTVDINTETDLPNTIRLLNIINNYLNAMIFKNLMNCIIMC
jgi:hypothetical protein